MVLLGLNIYKASMETWDSGVTGGADARTCIEERVGGQGDAAGLGQERSQGDTLGLEFLVQRIEFVRGDRVRHAKLRHLRAATRQGEIHKRSFPDTPQAPQSQQDRSKKILPAGKLAAIPIKIRQLTCTHMMKKGKR